MLYSFRRCPYAMRARLAIAVSGVQVTLREVVLRDKPAALREASAKATVPVLVLADGTVIDESLEIMLWALGQNDPAGWLTPDSGSLPDMLTLIGYNDAPGEGGFKHHLDRYKYPQRYPGTQPLAHRAEASRFLLGLDARLQRTANLFGNRTSLADMAIAPFVRQFAGTDAQWFATQKWPGLSGWLSRFTESPLFSRCMHKYAAWQPDKPPQRFPAD